MSITNLILQSVPITAQTDTNSSMILGKGEVSNTVKQQVPSMTDNLLDTIDQQFQSLESQIASQQTLIWVLFALIGICVIALFLMHKKNSAIKLKVAEEKKTASQLSKRLWTKVEELTGQMSEIKDNFDLLEQKEAEIEKEVRSKIACLQQNSRRIDAGTIGQTTRQDVPQQIETKNSVLNSSTKSVITKYFSLQEGNGQLFVKERNLKDDSSRSWFRMEIAGDIASYDINQHAISSILEDISTLRLCANDFDSNPSSTTIKTVKPGHLRKEGESWIVTDKITVKLI